MDFLLNILSHWDSVLAVLVVLGGLIFFHELGHFGMARLLGMGVRTFSLGFGPKLLTFRRGKTDYCLSLIPLGGYVALAGEEDDEEPRSSGESKDIDGIVFDANELFSERPAWNRLLVVLAGPVANFALALVICWVLALAQGETYRLPVVGSVLAESPAAAAGVQP
ncbi:MAG: site-2 protease family protein, partial [Bilophila sp.]